MTIDVKLIRGAGSFELAPGRKVPRRFRAFIEGEPDLDYDAVLEAEYEDGRMVVRELTLRRRASGPAVSTARLHDLPVAEWLSRAVKVLIESLGWPQMVVIQSAPDNIETALDRARVAYEYRLANLLGEPPTQAVAEYFGVARSTAGRWIAEARSLGLLGPPLHRKSGEGSD